MRENGRGGAREEGRSQVSKEAVLGARAVRPNCTEGAGREWEKGGA